MIEARDVYAYLAALEPYLDENIEFIDMQPKLKPLLHCVCLVWANSKYYCTSTRIITLLAQISNLLISQVRPLRLQRYDSDMTMKMNFDLNVAAIEISRAIAEDCKYFLQPVPLESIKLIVLV